MKTILVSGALANKYRNGGEAWVRLSWITGLRRLGFDVYFVEQIAPAACFDEKGAPAELCDSANLQYFQATIEQFGMTGRATLISEDGTRSAGIAPDLLGDIADSAELLVNISGHLTASWLLRRIARKAYIDIDPGFTQFWHSDPAMSFKVRGHDFYFTIGQNIGASDCPIPMGGIPWRPILQPVVLADWPVSAAKNPWHFTTVASWRGAFGPVESGGRKYGLKVHEFRKYLPLPELAGQIGSGPQLSKPSFEVALDIHPADARDLQALHAHGWQITDPRSVAPDALAFRRFVQSSGAEFSVAQGIYVDTVSGWFSDRTIRYLASGKPALVQETGFSRHLDSGCGLVPFSSLEQAADGARKIVANYEEHSAAARAIAERYFDSDKVLGRFLDEVGVKG